jgi:hypothetical protein
VKENFPSLDDRDKQMMAVQGFVKNSGVAYFGVFLICCGFNTNVPACMTYQVCDDLHAALFYDALS